MRFDVEGNVPLPKQRKGRSSVYPFAEMRDGDSFFVPATKDRGPEIVADRVRSAACAHRKSHARTGRFSVHMVEGGARCWYLEGA